MKKVYTVSVFYRAQVEAESEEKAVREATFSVPAVTFGLAVTVLHAREAKKAASLPEEAQPNAS